MANFRDDHPISLKWGLLTTVVLCWVVPIAIVVSVAGFLLKTSYERSLGEIMESSVDRAMEQMEMRLGAALEASKAVSYDGEVRSAYRKYQKTQDGVQLYTTVTDYLSRSFSRDENFRAVYITFLDHPSAVYPCVSSQGAVSYTVLQEYRLHVREQAMAAAGEMDTGICFLTVDGEVYMIRNLLDSSFSPYAVLVMLCDTDVIFQSLRTIAGLTSAQITIDDTPLELTPQGEIQFGDDEEEIVMERSAEVEGHRLAFAAKASRLNIWGTMPELRGALLLIALLVLPILMVIVLLFYRHVSHPVEVLVSAAQRVRGGERGYLIREIPNNKEMRRITSNFNEMSTELKSQFDRLYLEQQALQEARIKALQSQINPHFLGNTLEIINWEARLAENDKVSAMIEALATMLDAAIGRDGRSQIPLREELGYVDAYLYIIKERLGGRLTVVKEIAPDLLEEKIPRLLLQPLVENAVEHDISKRRGGELCLRARRQGNRLCLEVEHDGTVSPEDLEKISRFLAPDAPSGKGSVGIRNVNQRLRLLYGEKSGFTIAEAAPGRVLARVLLPLEGK